MILFECNNETVERAVFAGDVESLTAELLLEINVLYGSIKMKSDKAANEFRRCLTMTMIDPEGAALVFTDEVAKYLLGMGGSIASVIKKAPDADAEAAEAEDETEIVQFDPGELEAIIEEFLSRGRRDDDEGK